MIHSFKFLMVTELVEAKESLEQDNKQNQSNSATARAQLCVLHYLLAL